MTVFVGRQKEISEAIDALIAIDQGVLWDIVGVHGIGKSEFLLRVTAETTELAETPVVVVIDMMQRGLDDGFDGDYGANASAAVLWQTFVRSRELMLELSDYMTRTLRSEDFDLFREVCERKGMAADDVLSGHDFRVAPGEGSTPSVADQALRARIRDLQRGVDDAFVEAWTEMTRRRRVLATVDSFEVVASNELGHWMVRMALRFPRTLTLVARTPGPDLAHQLTRVRQLELPHFTVEEVAAYLTRRIVGEDFGPEIPQVVHDYTDGHPGGTELAARLILETGSIDARSLRRLLDRLPDEPRKRWSGMVRLIVEAIHDPLLRKAVDAASVARTFDEPLLAALLGLEHEEGAGDALKTLVGLRMLQPVADGAREDRYRMIEFIRLSLSEDLRANHRSRWQHLHGRAEGHYFKLLQDEEEQVSSGAYGQWYRYERASWQANKQDWLHHAGQLPESRELTRARFTLVFLEALWWWGWYVRFDFNRRLVEDWERAVALWSGSHRSATFVEDQQLADALWFVLDNYPTGSRKAPTAPWDEIRARLILIQSLCGLDSGSHLPSDATERRQLARTRGMIRVFLAHTRKYADPRDPAADRYYSEALKAFQALSDVWVVEWLLFEMAELALDRGEPRKADQLLVRSVSLLLASISDEEGKSADGAVIEDFGFEQGPEGGWDFELMANLHRIRADILWQRGELDGAAIEYGRALACAYWFQGHPHAADAYTVAFYKDIVDRVVQRVVDVQEVGGRTDGFAMAVASELPTLMAPEGARLGPGSVDPAQVQSLFPKAPDGATELRIDSPFMTAWRLHWEDREDPMASMAPLTEALDTPPSS